MSPSHLLGFITSDFRVTHQRTLCGRASVRFKKVVLTRIGRFVRLSITQKPGGWWEGKRIVNRRSTQTKTKHTLYRNSVHARLSLGFKRHLIIARVQIERSSIRASSSARTPHHTLPCHAHLNTLSRSLDGGHHMSRRCHRGGLASLPHTPNHP